jgi:S1-C subfamily serine protease
MKSGMRALFSIMALMFFSSSAWGYDGHNAVEDITRIRKGVVRLSVTAQVPDYSVPWNPGRITRGVGTGFLISGKRILTNAHISSNARFIAVQKENDSRMYEAKVKFIAHDCDLALLEVPENSFFDGMSPLSLGGMPSLDSTVTVLGYPIGGSRLSVTRGVVSRIDFRTYSHSAADTHLTIQIDAAINPGNSGGPVLQNNEVVGVAFQGFSGDVAQNVGYMIPVPVIERFLTDIKDGQYDRYVDLSTSQFPLLNNAYRRAMGLAPGDYGVIVSSVLKTSHADRILRPGDVLLAIDGLPIFSNGYVEMGDERVRMEEVVERKYKGDSVRLKIIRDRKEIDVTVPLASPWPYLIQAKRHDVKPRFVVYGGLIFQPLSYDFLKASNIKDVNIIYHSYNFINNEIYLEKPEIIVLSKILPDPINVYLRGFVNSIVQKINDKEIRTLEDVSEIFKEPADYYVIKLLGKHRPVVLERKEVEKARNRIISGYGVLNEEYLGDSIVPADWLDVSLKKN